MARKDDLLLVQKLLHFTDTGRQYYDLPPLPPQELIDFFANSKNKAQDFAELMNPDYRASYFSSAASAAYEYTKATLKAKMITFITTIVQYINSRLVYEEEIHPNLSPSAREAAEIRNELRERVVEDANWQAAVVTVLAMVVITCSYVAGPMAVWSLARSIVSSLVTVSTSVATGAIGTVTGAAQVAGATATVAAQSSGVAAAHSLSEVFNKDPEVVTAQCLSQWQTVHDTVCSYEWTKDTRFCTQMAIKGPEIIQFVLDHSINSDKMQRLNEARMGASGRLLWLSIVLSEKYRYWGFSKKISQYY